VALLALSSRPDLQRFVTGVVCLATPFIHVRSRDISHLTLIGITLLSILALPFGCALLNSAAWWLGLPLLIGAIVGIVSAFGGHLSELFSYAEREGVDQLMIHDVTCAVLVIRTPGDEALGWLRAIDKTPEIIRKVVVWPLFTARLLGCALVPLGIILMALHIDDPEAFGPIIFIAVLSLPLVGAFEIIVGVLRSLVRGGLWSWGEHLLWAFHLEVRALGVPPGCANVKEKIVIKQPAKQPHELRHSLYLHPEARTLTAQFINRRI
jgi:hypothetical protein